MFVNYLILNLNIFLYSKIIADNGYGDEHDLISTQNDIDCFDVKKFKERVLARQESFNSWIKNFACLNTKWRYGKDTHGIAFKACCVLNHYEMLVGEKSLLIPYP